MCCDFPEDAKACLLSAHTCKTQRVFLLRLPNQAQKSTRVQRQSPWVWTECPLEEREDASALTLAAPRGFHLTSKSGLALSLNSKVTLARWLSSPLDLSFCTQILRGWQVHGRLMVSQLTLLRGLHTCSQRAWAQPPSPPYKANSHPHLTATDLWDATLRLEALRTFPVPTHVTPWAVENASISRSKNVGSFLFYKGFLHTALDWIEIWTARICVNNFTRGSYWQKAT